MQWTEGKEQNLRQTSLYMTHVRKAYCVHEVFNEGVGPLPSSSPTSSWIMKSKSLSFRVHSLRSRDRVFLAMQAARRGGSVCRLHIIRDQEV
jgi:hypothetical protein